MKTRTIIDIYKNLLKSYGPQGWWPLLELGRIDYKPGDKHYGGYHPGDYSFPKNSSQIFEICIGAILTQNTSWNQVCKALINLKDRDLLDPNKVLRIDSKELGSLIRPAGYFNQKARKLKIFSEYFIKLGQRTPSREELLSVWGIGRETADSILIYAFKVPTFVIDTYTKKIFLNLGLIQKDWDYDQIKALFEKSIKPDLKIYQEYHALIVEHAKRYYSKGSDHKLDSLLYQIQKID